MDGSGGGSHRTGHFSLGALAIAIAAIGVLAAGENRAQTPTAQAGSPIVFENVTAAAGLSTSSSISIRQPDKHMVETMAGGLAVFDYDGDGRPDIFFTNGAPIPSLENNRRRTGTACSTTTAGFHFSDVTEAAGVRGRRATRPERPSATTTTTATSICSWPVFSATSCCTTRAGIFEDVTAAARIKNYTWSVAAGWFDYDNDGWLDLFIVNYVDWTPETNKFCGDRAKNLRVYCHPKHYAGLPNALYRQPSRRNVRGRDGEVRDWAAHRQGHERGVRRLRRRRIHRRLRHERRGSRLPVSQSPRTERSRKSGCWPASSVPASGRPVSSMGIDFRDYDNDGWPDIVLTALTGETFPLYKGDKSGIFRDVAYESGLARSTVRLSGWAAILVDLDNDGFKDLITANSHANDRVEAFEATTYRQANARLSQCERTVRGRLVARRAGLHGGARASRHRRRRLRRRRPARCRRHRAGRSSRSSFTTSAAAPTAG